MSSPAVIGIDTNSFGFHAVSSKPLVWLPDGWGVPLPFTWVQLRGDAEDRRRLMFAAARSVFERLPPATAVFVEEPLVLPKNIETTRKLVMAAAVLEAAFFAAEPDASWFWVSLSTWRKTVLGKGAGRKEEMKKLAQNETERWWSTVEWNELAGAYEQQPDLYDAACIMRYGSTQLSSGAVQIR